MRNLQEKASSDMKFNGKLSCFLGGGGGQVQVCKKIFTISYASEHNQEVKAYLLDHLNDIPVFPQKDKK